MREFLRARRYPTLLTFVSVAILAAGVLLKPEKAKTAAAAPISESETVRLQQMAQKKSLEDLMAFFSAAAANAGQQVAYLPEANASGILWKARAIVTVAAQSPVGTAEERVLLPRGQTGSARREPSEGVLALLRFDNRSSALNPAVMLLPDEAVKDSWVVQVSRKPDGSLLFTPGLFRGVVPVTCGEGTYREIDSTIELTPRMAAGGIFDLDGRLLGIIARCGERMAALSAADVETALHPRISMAASLENHWGARFTTLDETAKRYFRTEKGLLVQEVHRGGVADRSGLQPGDVLISVGDRPMQSLDDLANEHEAVLSGEAKVSVLSSRRIRLLTLAALQNGEPDSSLDTAIGLRLETPPEGVTVENVAPGSAARRAGVKPGDRLLQVNGTRIRRRDDVPRLLKRSPGVPRYLIVGRGDRQVGLFVP